MARYVLFASSHDGSTAIRVRRTGIRAVCRNTFTLALGGRPSGADLRLRHAVGVDTLRHQISAWLLGLSRKPARDRLLSPVSKRPVRHAALV